MIKLTAIILLATVWLCSCNQNPSNKTLKGKKFYAITADTQSTRRVMANTPITFETITISEEEFYFSSDSALIITPTVVYININKEVFQIYLKQLESALSPREYRYSYKNGNLDIYEASAQTITIEEHDNFYSTSTGETFYKQSIARLTADEKRERISKIITVKDGDMETLLKSELLLSDLGMQDSINPPKELEVDKGELVASQIEENVTEITQANQHLESHQANLNKLTTYFEGTKWFCDRHNSWIIKVTINDTHVKVETMPDPENEYWQDKTHLKDVNYGHIKDGKIYAKWDAESEAVVENRYKYQNGIWYEANTENGYNEYIECTIKEKITQEGQPINFENVEIAPQPPNGIDSFNKWMQGNFKHPSVVIDTNGKSITQVSFIVERDGSLTDFKIIKDLGYGISDAIIDVLKKSPRWIPGIQNGRPVRVIYILPIKIEI